MTNLYQTINKIQKSKSLYRKHRTYQLQVEVNPQAIPFTESAHVQNQGV